MAIRYADRRAAIAEQVMSSSRRRNHVAHSISWELVAKRLDKYRNSRARYEDFIRNAPPPYYRHPLAWRLGTWS
jgi:hypothetical protein